MPKISWRVFKSSLIGGAVIFGITLVIVFLNLDISRRTGKIEAIRDRSEVFRVSISEYEELKSNYDLSLKAFEIADASLPSRDQLATLPREMERLGEEYGLGLGFAFGTESVVGEGEVGSIIYDLTASGNFEDLLAFLKAFEAHPYYMSMRSFNLAKSVNLNPNIGGDSFVLRTQGEIFTR